MKAIHKILFIRTDRIGDVLMNLPSIHLLRQAHPEARIDLLTSTWLGDLLGENPDMNRVIQVDPKKIGKNFFYFLKVWNKIFFGHYQLAVVSNPDKWLHLLVFLSGIPIRVGYGRKWPFFLTKTLPAKKDGSARHEIDANLELTALAAPMAWDGRYEFPSSADARKAIHQKLSELGIQREIIALHVGTTNPDKRWDMKELSRLCDHLCVHNQFEICLLGGPEEINFAQAIEGLSKNKIYNWTGSMTLAELKAFFDHPSVRLLISCDSGPVHIAWMSGKPVIALYAKNVPGSNPIRWGPRDGHSRVIYKPVGEISAEEVYQAFLDMRGAQR